MQKFSTPLLVAAVALRNADGGVLMQRRRIGAAHGGLWEFPGGKLEPGESPEAAAIREIEEELGVTLVAAALTPIAFASGPTDPPRGLVILLYSCREWNGDPVCREGEEIRWFDPADLPALAMPPLDYPLAQAMISASGK